LIDILSKVWLNQKPEDESMGDKEGWHERGWNEECGSQCARINLNP